jgi:CBS domain-containing protein
MYEASKIMGEKHIGSLIVIKYATAVAIVTERDLLSKVLSIGLDLKEVTVEKFMSFPLISICPTIQIKEAAQIMIKKKGRLAVFECGKLVGIVTASDLIRSLPEAPETQLKVDDFMTKEIIEFDGRTSIARVAKAMGQRRVGSVIVTNKGLPTGIFTERDLLTTFLAKDKTLDVPLSSVTSSSLITCSSGISVHEAAYVMTSNHIRRLPIKKDDALVGIITARDLVEAYAK